MLEARGGRPASSSGFILSVEQEVRSPTGGAAGARVRRRSGGVSGEQAETRRSWQPHSNADRHRQGLKLIRLLAVGGGISLGVGLENETPGAVGGERVGVRKRSQGQV